MTPTIQDTVYEYAEKYNLGGSVLEVGSYDVNGSVRPGFLGRATEYIGTDMEMGPSVDMVINNKDLSIHFGEKQFDVVMALEVLEHDINFWDTVVSLKRLVKDGGHMIISTPSNGFPEHSYPSDYWRFMDDTYKQFFFKDFDILEMDHTIWDGLSSTIAIGKKK